MLLFGISGKKKNVETSYDRKSINKKILEIVHILREGKVLIKIN